MCCIVGHGETWGAGVVIVAAVDIHSLLCEIQTHPMIFEFGLYQYEYITQRSSNGTEGCVIRKPCSTKGTYVRCS